MPAGMRVAILAHHPGLTLSYARVAREVGYGLERLGAAVTWLGLAPARTSPASHRQAILLPQNETLEAIASWLAAHKPDVLLSIGDPWMYLGLPALVRKLDQRWCAYFPIDGKPLPEPWEAWVSDCDVPIVYSQFAADVVRRAIGVAPTVVPHGVDQTIFRPLDRDAARKQVGVSGFVVGTVAANQQRKNLPALFEAFAIFAKQKPEAMLYLHTPVAGPCWDLQELAQHFGIEAQTHATLGYDATRGISDEELAQVYNSFDVFALPTMSEGFGLPLIEAQACGVATIATDYSACPEWLPDPVQRVAVKTHLIMARNLEQAVVDVDDLASKLERLYVDPALRQRLADEGRTFVAPLTWEACALGIARAIGLG